MAVPLGQGLLGRGQALLSGFKLLPRLFQHGHQLLNLRDNAQYMVYQSMLNLAPRTQFSRICTGCCIESCAHAPWHCPWGCPCEGLGGCCCPFSLPAGQALYQDPFCSALCFAWNVRERWKDEQPSAGSMARPFKLSTRDMHASLTFPSMEDFISTAHLWISDQ